MEIKIEDYLSEDEIKEMVSAEVRKKAREAISAEPERVLGNIAYYTIEDAIDRILTDEERETIRAKTREIIADTMNYSVFGGFTHKTTASEIVDKCVKENAPAIKEKVKEIIMSFDYKKRLDEVYINDYIADAITDALKNGFGIK